MSCMRSIAALLAFAALTTTAVAAATAFKPIEGRYIGHYTSGQRGTLSFDVGPLRKRLEGVTLHHWTVTLRCPGYRSQRLTMEMAAARIGRDFSGFRMFADGGRDSLTGTFTSMTTFRGVLR